MTIIEAVRIAMKRKGLTDSEIASDIETAREGCPPSLNRTLNASIPVGMEEEFIEAWSREVASHGVRRFADKLKVIHNN